MQWILLGGGILVILVMGAYLLHLLCRLKRQKQKIWQARFARVMRLKESIILIAQAMQREECNLSEGVIRIKNLLDPLGLTLTTYPAMQRLYGIVEKMPTHQKREDLDRKTRSRLDAIRVQAEKENQGEIEKELVHLIAEVEAFSLIS